MRILALTLLLQTATCLAGEPTQEEKSPVVDRSEHLWHSYGTYNAAPRDARGRVDVARLTGELSEIRANTYNWLIWHAETDWDDLKQFLPLARQKGILVWVTLVPPTESPPHTKTYSEPFRLDYGRWAREIARLSVKEPNLVAWSIDDFTHNLKFFSPERMRKILAGARRINPNLAFVPCCYYPGIAPSFVRSYEDLFDGILFPYRYESARANLKDSSLVVDEVQHIKGLVGPKVPVIVDVYATGHSRLGNTTPQYVREVMSSAQQCADGVHVYCHQDKESSPEKYEVVKRLLSDWDAKRKPRLRQGRASDSERP